MNQSASICMERIDTFVAEQSVSNETIDKQILDFQAIADTCPDMPQIFHNLAVLVAKQQRWEDAIALLQKSLALDERAQHTALMLQTIHRFRAVQAYREALQSNNPAPQAPVLELQDSSINNFRILEDNNSAEPVESRDQLLSLLERWWNFSYGQTDNCDECFSQPDMTRLELTGATHPELEREMPEPYIIESGEQRVAVFKVNDNLVLALHIRPFSTGWIIDNQQVVP